MLSVFTSHQSNSCRCNFYPLPTGPSLTAKCRSLPRTPSPTTTRTARTAGGAATGAAGAATSATATSRPPPPLPNREIARYHCPTAISQSKAKKQTRQLYGPLREWRIRFRRLALKADKYGIGGTEAGSAIHAIKLPMCRLVMKTRSLTVTVQGGLMGLAPIMPGHPVERCSML